MGIEVFWFEVNAFAVGNNAPATYQKTMCINNKAVEKWKTAFREVK